MNQQKHIAVYLRSATGNLEDITRQRKKVIKEFRARNFDQADVPVIFYIDERDPGLTPGPELRLMHEAAERGEISALLVSRLNRISCSSRGLTDFFRFVEFQKLRFICAHENIDSIHWHALKGCFT
jgi:DNA invertase Pin-like site-specific DNA recombinase